jgi:hypothetical protein
MLEVHIARVRLLTQLYAAPVERQSSNGVDRTKSRDSAIPRSLLAQPVTMRPVAHRPGRKVRLEHGTLANRARRHLCQRLPCGWRFVTVCGRRFFAEDCGSLAVTGDGRGFPKQVRYRAALRPEGVYFCERHGT